MSTFLSLHYHVVFSTKHRAPLIDAEWKYRLHEYLGGTVSGLGGIAQSIGGVADHVHLLLGLTATHCLADFMRDVKRSATVWVHEVIGDKAFAWQAGYPAFTVGVGARDSVKRYIANQESHHRVRSFREELIDLLERAEIKYDERYLD
jgi:REP element-mobilizing transposase RayT